MTTAPFPVKPQITVANPDAEPTDAWIRAIAVMLLADVDGERREGQEHDDHSLSQECQV